MKKPKKKSRIPSQRTNKHLVRSGKKSNKKISAKPKAKSTSAKKQPQVKILTIKKNVPKPRKYYITISGKKVSLDNEIIIKYNLNPGEFLPFSRYKVFVEK